jgi:hypothetical protein
MHPGDHLPTRSLVSGQEQPGADHRTLVIKAKHASVSLRRVRAGELAVWPEGERRQYATAWTRCEPTVVSLLHPWHRAGRRGDARQRPGTHTSHRGRCCVPHNGGDRRKPPTQHLTCRGPLPRTLWALANKADGHGGRASPSGSACDHRCYSRASLVLASRALRVPVASASGGPSRSTTVGRAPT